MKKIKGLIGFRTKNVIFGYMDVIAEVHTGGEDFKGYPNRETLGVGINELGNNCLTVSSSASSDHDTHTAIHLNSSGKDLAVVLRQLADKLDNTKGIDWYEDNDGHFQLK
jgi:hypothetical protein